MTRMARLVQFVRLLPCRHKLSWPRRRNGETYVFCVTCGREFMYSWETMTVESKATFSAKL